MVHGPQMASGHGLCQWPDSRAEYVCTCISIAVKNNTCFPSFVFTLRSQWAPPGIAHHRVRGTRYRVTATGTGTGATTLDNLARAAPAIASPAVSVGRIGRAGKGVMTGLSPNRNTHFDFRLFRLTCWTTCTNIISTSTAQDFGRAGRG
jgi:hypothetical protein